MVTVYELVRDKGRAYLYKGKYPQLMVFSTSLTDMDRLTTAFGGHYYSHKGGFTWLISKRSEIASLMIKMKPYLPSRYGFELVVGDGGGPPPTSPVIS